MKYSQSELEAMSENELNALAADYFGFDTTESIGDEVGIYCGYNGKGRSWRIRDYCNNPSDIMPIARDSMFVIQFARNRVIVTSSLDGYECDIQYKDWKLENAENLYCKAICIVFILIEQDKENSK